MEKTGKAPYMSPLESCLTPSEKHFRLWMRFSVCMYAAGLPFFLFFGGHLTAFLNGLPATIFQLPPWPIAGEGAVVSFWQVLGVSLMAILGLVCLFIARDVRRYGPVITALLAAKLVSTLCYGALFLNTPNGAYFVGIVTDGSIFTITLALWYLASPADRYLDEMETRVLTAAGEAILPSGGCLSAGYPDDTERCLREARRLLAAQSTLQLLLTRLMIRFFDLLPLLKGRFGRFHRLPLAARITFFEQLETSALGPFRLIAVAIKLYCIVPYYNEEVKGSGASGESMNP